MNTLEVTIERVIKIWWFLMWRTILVAMIAGFVMGIILGLLLLFTDFNEQTKQYIYQGGGLLVGVPVGIWVLSLAFEKSFSDFKIVLVGNEITEPHDAQESNASIL